MSEREMKETMDEALWVLVRLQDSIYAFQGTQVESILLLDHEIVKLPNSSDLYPGTIHYRGGVIPVLDLRCIVGLESRETEQHRFEQMLEDRKQDHIRWVDTLKNCAVTEEPFTLATDPLQCTFGKWYAQYKPDDQTVAFHLKKIDEPHRNLHQMAVEVIACKQEHDACKRAECLKTSLHKATELYMPQVVLLLEEAKKVFRDSYRKMVVVLTDGTSTCGVLVDEVRSAEPLDTLTETYTRPGNEANTLITHVGARKEHAESILVIDLERLFEKYL